VAETTTPLARGPQGQGGAPHRLAGCSKTPGAARPLHRVSYHASSPNGTARCWSWKADHRQPAAGGDAIGTSSTVGLNHCHRGASGPRSGSPSTSWPQPLVGRRSSMGEETFETTKTMRRRLSDAGPHERSWTQGHPAPAWRWPWEGQLRGPDRCEPCARNLTTDSICKPLRLKVLGSARFWWRG